MAQSDRYSRFVGWTKVLLPLMGLTLLSTVFLFAGKVDVTQSLPYAELNVEELIREQRISAPYYSGITQDGTKVSLTAAYAKPAAENPDDFIAEDIHAQLHAPDQQRVDVTARQAQFSSAENKAVISGGVKVQTQTGYIIQTEALSADFKNFEFATQDAITAQTPIGALDAGTLDITKSDGDVQIRFTNGVRLIYQPQ